MMTKECEVSGIISVLPSTVWIPGVAKDNGEELAEVVRVWSRKVELEADDDVSVAVVAVKGDMRGVRYSTWLWRDFEEEKLWEEPGAKGEKDGEVIAQLQMKAGVRVEVPVGERWFMGGEGGGAVLIIRQTKEDEKGRVTIVRVFEEEEEGEEGERR